MPNATVLQVRFVEFRGVTGRTVSNWAHAAGVPALRRHHLLHLATPGTDEGAFILDLATTTLYTWDEIAGYVAVRPLTSLRSALQRRAR